MSDTTDRITRRSVLRTTGALGALGLAGTASAITTQDLTTGQCVVADGSADVYGDCGIDLAFAVTEDGTQGTVKKVCEPIDGGVWGYVAWDASSDTRAADGWVREEDLSACVEPH